MDVAAREIAARQDRPRPADPCRFVIFGAAGDLTKRLLVPALYNLAADHLLPERFAVVGVARADIHDESFLTITLESGESFHNAIHAPR